MFWHFFLNRPKILASKESGFGGSEVKFYRPVYQNPQKGPLELIIGGFLPKGSLTFCLWRFFWNNLRDNSWKKNMTSTNPCHMNYIWGILKCRNPFQIPNINHIISITPPPKKKRRKIDISLTKGPSFLNGKFSILWHPSCPVTFRTCGLYNFHPLL